MNSPDDQSAASHNDASHTDAAQEIAYEMAYGLSHELNNPLANIAGRARLLAERESDPEKRQQLAIIVDQAMRGCEMIADLMLFARPPAWNPQSVNLRGLVADLHQRSQKAPLVQRLNVQLAIDAGLMTAMVHADQQALSEALWAVLRNALEAARSQVSIALKTHVDQETSQACFQVTIEDDGPGLSPQALANAFHPYFSGREAGRGLGLGLSKAQRIFARCSGHIALCNLSPNGCQAILTLPSR